MFAVLRDRDTQKTTWHEAYEEKHKKEVLNTINKMNNILKEDIKPTPNKNINKCKACNYNKVCEFSLTKTFKNNS
ncbi:Dna2/Cas4 domain-containing protein [archaeon]|nr:Dna2/Cas4 domain-containing protein [archaeon]